MDWIITLILGAVIGWLASSMMGMKSGLVTAIVVGLVGSVLARWLFGNVLGWGGAAAGAFSIMGIVWGVLGAIVLIWLLRALKVIS